MVFDLDQQDPLARVNAFWDLFAQNQLIDRVDDETFWDHPLHAAMKPLSSVNHSPSEAGPNGVLSTTRWLLKVDTSFCNRNRVLHGGAAATVFDIATSVALAPVASKGKFGFGGVSRTLNCSYLKRIPEGMTVVIICEVMNIGGRLATVRAHMREWVEDEKEKLGGREVGEALATCEHCKANTDLKI